ncbi:hypothetical protein NTGHW29_650077 [Candidatus Nitrotoga sp. HW29]|nr:hypothetical protein NTGHW29_650077 [Candidatus Nitrotoga sp. HW29]
MGLHDVVIIQQEAMRTSCWLTQEPPAFARSRQAFRTGLMEKRKLF